MALTSNSTSITTYFERDCQEIHRAWDRPGRLCWALAHRTPTDRQQIKESYKAIYGKDLMEGLRRHRDVPVCAALYLWMLDPHERDAAVAREALVVQVVDGGRIEADYKALVEMYARRKSSQLFFTRQAYVANFKAHLEQDIVSSEPSHSYQKILAALATSHRSHHHEESVSQHIAKCDAKKLYGAVKESTRLNEATILEIFSKRSIPQLRLAFSSYNQIYGHDFTTALKRESSSGSEFEESLRVVIQCMCHPFDYYSEMVYSNLKGGMLTRRVLTRVVMGSAEAGTEQVSAAFEKRYGSKIQDAIRENIAADGDYRDFLLALTNAN